MAKKKLPQKLDELMNLFNGSGWLTRLCIRAVINKVGGARIREKIGECADAAADDYCSSRLSEYTIEPKLREMSREFAEKTYDTIDRWAMP